MNKTMQNLDIFEGKLMKSAIKINNNIVVFKSNKVVSKGQDNLIFFHNKSNHEINTIKNKKKFSFTFSSNGLLLLPIQRENNDNIYKYKILLCACKKYLKTQKNGILMINIDDNISNNDLYTDYNFYSTGNFEVYCFCPIFIIKNTEVLKNKYDINDTDYFFVGGFDSKKCKGMIKLYKVIYGEKYNETKIEYIQDIYLFDKNVKRSNLSYKSIKRFKGPISCITQSSRDGKILITCWDGNIYLCDCPDITYYLEYDKQAKK